MSIAVLIPSRDRPDLCERAVHSVMNTSKYAEAMVYVDADQKDRYREVLNSLAALFPTRVHSFIGTRAGPVASANELVKYYGGYNAYGFLSDDAVIATPDWDHWLLEAVSHCPNRIGVISPYHNFGNHVDMPFVSREWISVTGWYACPDVYHYCWPIITGLIGEMTGIIHAPQGRFAIEHDTHEQDKQAQTKDAQPFFEYVSLKLPAVVEKLRTAMYA